MFSQAPEMLNKMARHIVYHHFPFAHKHDAEAPAAKAFTDNPVVLSLVVQDMTTRTPFVRRDRKVPTQSGKKTWGASFPEIFSKLEGRSL